MTTRVLLCDDDPIVHEALGVYLKKYGFTKISAYNGKQCLELFETEIFDIVILDIMMPVMDGITVCKTIRKTSFVPIIMLTAKSEEMDRLTCFEIGADDYITKPFSSMEVIARIRAILNRVNTTSANKKSGSVNYKGLHVDITRYIISIDGEAIHATPKEVELLYLLLSNPKTVFTREQIMNIIWGYEYSGDTRTIDTHIKRIRAKLPSYMQNSIKTIYGVGYKFETPEQDNT